MNNLTERFWNSWRAKVTKSWYLGELTFMEYLNLYSKATYHVVNFQLERTPEIDCKTIWPYIRG